MASIEDKVNEKAVRTYRQMQQSLEAVAFALQTTLQQLHKLSLDETRPEEQMAKQLLGEFPDKVLPLRAVQMRQTVSDIAT